MKPQSPRSISNTVLSLPTKGSKTSKTPGEYYLIFIQRDKRTFKNMYILKIVIQDLILAFEESLEGLFQP